jgi:redox-sensitive bicupin YhaK (pirin superfamily)
VIAIVIEQRRRDLGGFEVGRVLPHPRQRMVGPFIFLDHMGPVDFPAGIPRSVDVRPHPHIGLATVTYLFEGEIMHRDSLGSAQPIRPFEVNWMTAGRGITHSERFERARREGGHMNGIQAWVALPNEHEEVEPAFAHHSGAELPKLDEDGVSLRLVAGEMAGLKAAVKLHSPLFYAHCRLAAGARVQLPRDYAERAAYVASGTIESDGRSFLEGQMIVFGSGDAVIKAVDAATVMLLGGEPVGERFIEWNFVSSSRERIEQAKSDWRAGRMKLPYMDDQEFIPLPEDPKKTPPNAMS